MALRLVILLVLRLLRLLIGIGLFTPGPALLIPGSYEYQNYTVILHDDDFEIATDK